MPEPSRTRTRPRAERSHGEEAPAPHLFGALLAHAPHATKRCWSLADRRPLRIGRLRSGHHGWLANLYQMGESGDGAIRELGVPDELCSKEHVVVRYGEGAWQIEDFSSKNGTLVNGESITPKTPTLLHDGDLIELGNSFFWFRAAIRPACDEIRSGDDLTFSSVLSHDLEYLQRPHRALLLVGETGVGKEVAARRYHVKVRGGEAPFVAVNCAAIPDELFESQLFGARRGAYTGSRADRLGDVTAADGGTLLLDEIGELPLELQPKLLRVLEERAVTALGDTRARQVDFTLVAATNRDLDAMVQGGTFRRDLLARLRPPTVHLPPLRERREDLGVLIGALLQRIGRPQSCLTAAAARALLRYSWPDNVRQLERVLETALTMVVDPDSIDTVHLSPEVQNATRAGPAVDMNARAGERNRLLEAIEACGANKTEIARRLGVARPTVDRMLARHSDLVLPPRDLRRR